MSLKTHKAENRRNYQNAWRKQKKDKKRGGAWWNTGKSRQTPLKRGRK